jgi:predicted transcriptional regulator
MKNSMQKLPNSEFDVMRVVWSSKPAVTSKEIMSKLGTKKDWKPQTLLTLLLRLTDKGFLRSEKHGKERTYYPLIDENDYLQFETQGFIEKFHKNSFMSLVNTLYKGKKLSDEDLDEFMQWINDKE